MWQEISIHYSRGRKKKQERKRILLKNRRNRGGWKNMKKRDTRRGVSNETKLRKMCRERGSNQGQLLLAGEAFQGGLPAQSLAVILRLLHIDQ